VTTVSAIVLTASLVVEATAGRLAAGSPAQVFTHVSTDTRTITPGALFVALKGERFDAHGFIAAGLAAGASGIVVSSAPAVPTGDAAVIVVPDTLRALQDLARTVRQASGARVIAITGSTGKTTTKEVTADLLSARYRVFRNRGNLNNHVGLPVSLLELVDRPDLAVVELGMNHEGEIRTLVRIAEPEVRVWTNVGDAHVGHFGSREAIARAKAEILEGATGATLVVSNADDPLVAGYVRRSSARQITFGVAAGATVRATDVEDRGFDGTSAVVQTPHGRLHLTVPLAGRAQLMNVLAATAIAVEFAVASEAIEQRVAALEPVSRRGAIRLAPNGSRVVDDSYNASPAAVRAMLAALAATPVDGRRVAVLGEMLELGSASRELHEACGRAAAAAGVSELVVIGGDAAGGLADGAIDEGLARTHVHRFADSGAAADHIHELVAPGDLVLVKGSRGTRTDLVADRLLGVA
jgi:UDP-N-acetylmuramoyl-tripeptide--D-alanyl-D-alanine ligase